MHRPIRAVGNQYAKSMPNLSAIFPKAKFITPRAPCMRDSSQITMDRSRVGNRTVKWVKNRGKNGPTRPIIGIKMGRSNVRPTIKQPFARNKQPHIAGFAHIGLIHNEQANRVKVIQTKKAEVYTDPSWSEVWRTVVNHEGIHILAKVSPAT